MNDKGFEVLGISAAKPRCDEKTLEEIQTYASIVVEFHIQQRFLPHLFVDNKTLAETFSKFPSVLRVIDRSDRNPPITATSVTF